MLKWFEQVDNKKSNVILSRVRLARNWDEYEFPVKLSDDESREMIKRLEFGLKDLGDLDGKEYEYAYLDELSDLDRMALRERRILNKTAVAKKSPTGIIISEDEETSMVLNSDDHIRLQVIAPGLQLYECGEKADKIDDYVNERISYAFDSQYGYLTSYPTNVGTGMKASVIVHLPSLALSRKFSSLLETMGRFGTVIRGVYGQGGENYGDLYEIVNQKTLGLTEKEIMDLVNRVAVQLTGQETQVREKSLENHRLVREDEVYKSYGVLKYARRLSMKDSLTFLSQLMAGIADGLIETKEFCSVYRLMLGVQPANLQKVSDRPLGKEELEVERARYLRSELPELK